MKTVKQVMIVAILATGLFASCTPESLDNGQTDQQINVKDIKVLQNG